MAITQRSKLLSLHFLLAILLSGWFVYINLSEFITIGILQQTGGYPFGGEGLTPWHYRTPQLYATVNLVFGLLFLAACITSCRAFIKNEKHFLFATIAMSAFLIFIELLNELLS